MRKETTTNAADTRGLATVIPFPTPPWYASEPNPACADWCDVDHKRGLFADHGMQDLPARSRYSGSCERLSPRIARSAPVCLAVAVRPMCPKSSPYVCLGFLDARQASAETWKKAVLNLPLRA